MSDNNAGQLGSVGAGRHTGIYHVLQAGAHQMVLHGDSRVFHKGHE